ncbi:hypothetical protein [Paenibacillus sp. Y412MC10]|uniref:hypothetical protein n=1 Tax=Geobacillus sp. (strain Y412MC10) TaxID=481743 RepID=UPI001642EA58
MAKSTISGTVRVPSSKYHLHRALIFGSLAEGETVIHGKSSALHIRDTLNSLKDFGIPILSTAAAMPLEEKAIPHNGRIRVFSSVVHAIFGSLSEGVAPVYNVHKELRERLIGPLLEALGSMGVKWTVDNYKMTVTIGRGRPKGGYVQIPGTLSQ